ncbi:MAG: hypothetical protein WDA75_20340, partial [Candidatus Latescibacterota bacterium]
MDTPSLHRLGPIAAEVEAVLARLRRERIVPRILDRDHTVWRDDPTEITNRLGWLDSPTAMVLHLPAIREVMAAAVRDGCTHALLLGMGGSSLAPEVFRRVFGVQPGHLDLAVLDSTDPTAVLARARELTPATTLYLPATKSGGTVETMSFAKFFFNKARTALGAERAGKRFVAITDPGSGLADLAASLGFRHTFLNDPKIGGRYSALSCFGLVAAGAVGVDLERLLARARAADTDEAAVLGVALGAAALAGRDKVTLIASSAIAPFGAWVEQLIAESTGKEGRGIVPVDNEPAVAPARYGNDRLFVHLRLADDDGEDQRVEALAAAGHPVLRIELSDLYDLGREFMRWELATAVAGWVLGINPFDQPDVEAAKVLARQMVQTYRQEGRLPSLEPTLREGELTYIGEGRPANLREALDHLLAAARPGRSYVAIQAFLPSTPAIEALLAGMRRSILERTGMATTVGYGPRFLHSTGQLHKGDAGHGLFLQLTADPSEDAPIPDEPGSDRS